MEKQKFYLSDTDIENLEGVGIDYDKPWVDVVISIPKNGFVELPVPLIVPTTTAKTRNFGDVIRAKLSVNPELAKAVEEAS